MTIRIAMWSGPRNISTALMRSFGARADCAVSDEPFYGAFLKHSGAAHPMASDIIADMDCDWQSVLTTQSGCAPNDMPIWYQKHMPHHMVGPISPLDMPHHRHAFLIRSPDRVVASYLHKNELESAEALGFAKVRYYFQLEADRLGYAPPVVDSDAILTDPDRVLSKLCAALNIPYRKDMLTWAKGPHKEDGIWGVHWYDKVNASTGFGPAPAELAPLSGAARGIADQCRADYEALLPYALS